MSEQQYINLLVALEDGLAQGSFKCPRSQRKVSGVESLSYTSADYTKPPVDYPSLLEKKDNL